jgi:hypothetical protein
MEADHTCMFRFYLQWRPDLPSNNGKHLSRLPASYKHTSMEVDTTGHSGAFPSTALSRNSKWQPSDLRSAIQFQIPKFWLMIVSLQKYTIFWGCVRQRWKIRTKKNNFQFHAGNWKIIKTGEYSKNIRICEGARQPNHGDILTDCFNSKKMLLAL